MRHRRTALALFAILALLVPAVASGATGNPFGNTVTLWAQLSGAGEGATFDADALGFAKVTIDPTTGEVCYRLSVANIEPATAAHIHEGAAGVNGPVVVPFTAPDADGFANGCVDADPALAQAIIANPSGYYVNVHNADYPGGVVRGQLMPFGEQPAAPGEEPTGPSMQVLVDGLANPRGIEMGADGLYVAQAGAGGDTCIDIPDPEEPVTLCFGDTGAVTMVMTDGMTTQVGDGLTSLSDNPDNMATTGPTDVAWDADGNLYAIVGLGAAPADRDAVGEPAAGLGHLYKLSTDGAWTDMADISAYEDPANPDGAQIDTNPYGLTVDGDTVLVADAGGNDLLAVASDGTVSTVAVFPAVMVDAPPELGLPEGTQIPMDAVPTSVVVGPDGAWYVSQLTGYPFPVGGAKIWRLDDMNGDGDAMDDGEMSVYAEGLTAVVGITFDADGNLYAVEIAKNGLGGAESAPPDDVDAVTGAVIKIAADGTQTEVASDGLILPGGVAVGADGSLYVTNFSIFPEMGQIVHIMP